MRDLDLNEIYMQYYKVVVAPINTFRLKNTNRNREAKSTKKYTNMTDTTAIIKCTSCHLHDASQLLEANQRAHRNFRSLSTCIYKQSEQSAFLLLIKSYQLYQDITLLKHYLTDILLHYDSPSNLSSLQDQTVSRTDDDQQDVDSPLNLSSNRHPPRDIVVEMIDRLIDSPVLSQKLKSIAATLSSDYDIQFYTDSSLQKNPNQLATMGFR